MKYVHILGIIALSRDHNDLVQIIKLTKLNFLTYLYIPSCATYLWPGPGQFLLSVTRCHLVLGFFSRSHKSIHFVCVVIPAGLCRLWKLIWLCLFCVCRHFYLFHVSLNCNKGAKSNMLSVQQGFRTFCHM